VVYHFRVHKDRDGLWAECLELPGCSTQGDSMGELLENAREALNLYLEEPEDSQLTFPLPAAHRSKDVIEVPVEPGVAFSVLLRNYRISNKYTQRQVAKKLGMKNLYSYQRLERRSNPNLATLQKIKRVFPDLSVDYVLGR
jgi:predicted RNase H-like HicB family nuclease/DNA-binding XRE family transcriptional regulator